MKGAFPGTKNVHQHLPSPRATQVDASRALGTAQSGVPSVTAVSECSSSSTPQPDEPIPRGLAQGTQPLELAESTSGGTLGGSWTVGTWWFCYCPSKEEEEIFSLRSSAECVTLGKNCSNKNLQEQMNFWTVKKTSDFQFDQSTKQSP